MPKYYYIKSGDKYLDGKENAFYSKIHLGTYTNSFIEAEKLKTYCIAQKEVILNDLKARLEAIKTNASEDKKERINLQKRIEWGTEDLNTYYDSKTVEVNEQEVLDMQSALQLDAVFSGQTFVYFLKDLKYNLTNLARLSKHEIKAIDSLVKILGKNTDFSKLVDTQEEMTYDLHEEHVKMITNISKVGYSEPKFLNEFFEMMQDSTGLATMKRALTNFKKNKNEQHN